MKLYYVAKIKKKYTVCFDIGNGAVVDIPIRDLPIEIQVHSVIKRVEKQKYILYAERLTSSQIFPARLKWIRLKKKIPLSRVAWFLGYDIATIVEYEKGAKIPEQETLLLLAWLFDVKPSFLIGNTDNPYKSIKNT